MSEELSLSQIKKEWHGTFKTYLIGFVSSLSLTIVSFYLVMAKLFSPRITVYTIVSLALVQAVVQLRYFLHLGEEDEPRWETLIFYFMLLVLFIIVIGSLWIMNNLNERMMNGMDM